MKFALGVCLIAAGMTGMVVAQDRTTPELRQGISVEMPVASEAVAMPAADEVSAMVVTVTEEGTVLLGSQPVEINALGRVPASTVYLKADARAPFQKVLTVLDALHGHSIVLLTAPTVKTVSGKASPPYGVRLAMGGKGSD